VSISALYNLSTVKAASQAVRDCLLEVPKKGKELHEAFIRDYNDDPDRFEKPISKVKLITFRNEGAKGRRKAAYKKIPELRCTRDLSHGATCGPGHPKGTRLGTRPGLPTDDSPTCLMQY